ncbi:unnamed protein product, partial [Didymodactylos carnosus]
MGNGARSFSSSYISLNAAFSSILLYANQKSVANDTDSDGIIDQYKIDFIVPLAGAYKIGNIDAWLFFDYELRGRQSVVMETLALISLVPPKSVYSNNVTVYGQLVFEQRKPIQSSGVDSSLNTSILTYDNGAVPVLNTILDNYFTRNYYTTFQQQYAS